MSHDLWVMIKTRDFFVRVATIFSSCEETKSLNEGGRLGRLRSAKLVKLQK